VPDVRAFIDIHSHVICGVDDGAETIQESRAMLALAAECGTAAIVATPHASARYPFRPEVIEQRIAELQGVAGVQIFPGCDFHLQFDNIEDAVAHPQKYTINHGCYLLVEFSDLGTLHGAEAMLARLLDAGMIPIVTHPERNAYLQKHVDQLVEWVTNGCYVQVTAGSFTGGFGRGARVCAETLLDRGLVHAVASDAHDCQKRTPNLRDAYARLADDHGADAVRPLFVDNPAAIVSGNPLEYDAAVPLARPPRRWYQFWA
jgi:protein-tyrosine phosphatase